MKLRTTFHGNDLLFEGDLPLTLRALPAGARVERATLTLAPVTATPAATDPTPPQLFRETFALTNGKGDFGVLAETDTNGAVLDLSARRTVREVAFNQPFTSPRVQVDLGGMWVQLVNDGQFAQPDSPDGDKVFPDGNTLVLPNLTSQRLRIFNQSAPPPPITRSGPTIAAVTLATYPANLTLKLGDLGSFWFRLGDLREPVTTPDFAAILQAFLERSEPKDGAYDVPFILHSDALARLQLELDVDFHIEQPLLPPELNEAVYPFQYAALPTAQPAPLQATLPLNATVLPKATSAQVAGRFDGTRVIHGAVSATRVRDTLRVTPAQSAAHPIMLPVSATSSAIDVNLETVTPTARLLIALQEDVGGKPWGPSLLPAPIEVKTERPAAGGSTWVSAPLPADFTFHEGETYWLIVNAVEGEVLWALEPAGDLPPLQVTRDAALSWRVHTSEVLDGAVAGVYRLRAQLPAFRQPIKLDVAGHEVSLRKLDALGKVDFTLDLPEVAAAMNAALADAVLQQTALSERVVNGDFSRWTRVDRRAGRLTTEVVELDGFAVPGTLGAVLTTLAVAPNQPHAYSFNVKLTRPDQGVVKMDWLLHAISNDPQPELAGAFSPASLMRQQMIIPTSAVTSPDGETLYLASSSGESSGPVIVQKFSTLSSTFQERREFAEFGSIGLLAPDPHCRYVYLAATSDVNETTGPVFVRLNANTLEYSAPSASLMSAPPTRSRSRSRRARAVTAAAQAAQASDRLDLPSESQFVLGTLVSPDGTRAYLATPDGVHVVDLAKWQLFGMAKTVDPTYGPTQRVVGCALSPDGAHLVVLLTDQDATNPAAATAGTSATATVIQTSLLDAIAARGGALAEASESSMEIEFDFSRAASSGIPLANKRQPLAWLAMQVTPDGTRLLIADHHGSELKMIDLAANAELDAIRLPLPPTQITIMPDSRRAYVVLVERSEEQAPLSRIQAVELDAWVANEWALTGGRVAPVYAPEATQPTARLGSPTDVTGLSQLFRIEGGRDYALRFHARASAPGATAELFWLNAQCGLLGKYSVDIKMPGCGAQLQPHALRARAPADADRAELRFRQPAGDYTLLDDVRLSAPAEATVNGDFAARLQGAPAAWSGMPATPDVPEGWELAPDASVTFEGDSGIRLVASALRPATLSQRLSPLPGQPFMLRFQANPVGVRSRHGAPSLELRWQDSATDPIVFDIDVQQFDERVVQGSVPQDATDAEIAFVQPAEGALSIRRVAFSQPQTAQIPLTYLSEAPGQLSVIEPVVAFDVQGEPHPAPAVKPTPEPLGCQPTPPDDEPQPPSGTSPSGEGYCPCCEGKHALDDGDDVITEGGMRGRHGTCPNCGTDVILFHNSLSE